ncbi:bifunctional adenosylcobinamide kinase/adenosylcobinamide-phosphate guanylyltransferase [Fusibacter bizertensis]|uniref:Adenosylcobinamide kinase n=1 Tax=Fusibacter bizertensis TaxID=1488331 RepID=A0ABT6NFF9_9FIRM|nr:bifunctional adenosylcobinamide kinase/adenosylcobinamide-phosphate guanylyltransferase [Fusibacter bizertensis]MDH8679149.1 bifunctional adenosylcobinamide kinase/adenosylcobinamide-phosphate guanylyltransferase [Fusibacter bizertensis]
MSKIHLVVGGARSGKSSFAEECAKNQTEKVVYLATAVVTDTDMANRIEKHKLDRPQFWHTIERYRDFQAITSQREFLEADMLLLDCLTVMTTNLMFEEHQDYDAISKEKLYEIEQVVISEIDELINIARKSNKSLIIVTNEVGMGLVPAYKLGSYFRDIAGRVNRHVASAADEVTFVAVGIPLKLK